MLHIPGLDPRDRHKHAAGATWCRRRQRGQTPPVQRGSGQQSQGQEDRPDSSAGFQRHRMNWLRPRWRLQRRAFRRGDSTRLGLHTDPSVQMEYDRGLPWMIPGCIPVLRNDVELLGVVIPVTRIIPGRESVVAADTLRLQIVNNKELYLSRSAGAG